MSDKFSHNTTSRHGQERSHPPARQSVFAKIRAAYEREVGLADPRSNPSIAAGGERGAMPDRPSAIPALAIGLLAGGLIVYLLTNTGTGSEITTAIGSLWETLIGIAIGLGILYGAWCLFWPILRNAMLKLIGWVIILGIAVYSFLTAIGY